MTTWTNSRNFLSLLLCLLAVSAFGHDLSAENASFVQSLQGSAPGPFLYLGAKHMFTGYDHLLFLLGVIFYLRRPRDILLYVTLFTLGHSLTLVVGVIQGWQINSHLVDAVIGLSVVYKGFENIGGFKTLFRVQPDPRIAVFVFGLCHGLGLATKLQEYVGRGDGLLTNMLSFNIGVELGQLAALALMLWGLHYWRKLANFDSQAYAANVALICAGLVLAGYQFMGYLWA